MKEIVLDFTKCKKAKNSNELYYTIKEKIPYYFDYGNNPNALWDVMRDYWDESEYVHFKLYGVNDLEYLQIEMKYIIDVFNDVQNETPNISFEIVS